VSVQLRRAVHQDLDALRDVYRRSSLSNPSDRDALLAHPDALEFVGDAIEDGRTLVAVDDGRIMGFATLGPVVAGAVELDDLFVDPDAMRRGIGRALVAEAVARARRSGCSRLDVTANPDARAFYESVGFVDTGTAETRFGPAPRMALEIHEGPPDPP
jgi:GNAT superfamily N-acetyltransferase